jgi:uncharacterized protein YbjQ (UPF0145 family)
MHRTIPRPLAAVLLGLALAGAAGESCARNDKLLLPVDAALGSNGTRQVLGTDIPLRFGKASANGADVTGTVQVHAVADPFGAPLSNGTRRAPLTDEQVCLAAFRKAVVELQAKARSGGAVAVVGIVSDYNNEEMDSREAYECHVGRTRAVVDLRGQLARKAPVQAVMAPPLIQGEPNALPQPRHIASGFAAIDDIDAIPYLSDRGRSDYAAWLKLPTPRAFAIAPNGYYWHTSGVRPRDEALPTDPVERALLLCERNAKRPCKLYAVNGAVVWTKDPQ